MADRAFIPPTKRRAMTKARLVRCFLMADGICHICGNPIRDGEKWQADHVAALSVGGADDDANLKPAHVKCHVGKTAAEAPLRAKRNRIITAGYAGKKTSRPMPGSRASGWRKRMNGRAERRT